MWLKKAKEPREHGFCSMWSRRYAAWLNLTYKATTDQVDPQKDIEEEERPLVETIPYETTSGMFIVQFLDPSTDDECFIPTAARERRTDR